jgi:hypothetical protein
MKAKRLQPRRVLTAICLSMAVSLAAVAFGETPVNSPQPSSPLTGDEVVRRMIERNLQRAKALHAFQGTRVYHLRYQGFAISKEAEMVTSIVYQAPDTKQFTEVSQTGSKLIVDKVFRKLLETEQEALKDENRTRTALNTDNYNFTLTGYEAGTPSSNYVFQVEPRNPTKFLYRGKIWIDAQDFAVSRMEVEPAKSPSFWTKKSEISHTYAKVGGFWLPKQNRSVSTIRLGGQAVLTIDYKDYKILDAQAVQSVNQVSRLAKGAH